ncbi:hypothetical protein Tco_1126621 [Tanacetum coccineum]
MSDSKDSTVTYTAVSSPIGGLSDIRSPRVDGPPVMPEDPYAYVFMPLEDEVLPAEEQPLPAAVSPTADSPGYVPKSDPEEDDDEDPEEDPTDYPADGGDDGDDEDESSDEDEDDEDVDIEGDKEEEEHPAPANSTVVALPAVGHALFAEETEPFETDESAATQPPHPAYRIPSPPLPPILSPLPVSPPPPTSPIRSLGYRAAMIRLRAEAASTSHSLPLPPPIILSHTRPDAPSSGKPPLHLLSTDRERTDLRPTGGLRADYGFVATMDREIRRNLKRDVGYGITDS